MNLNLKGDIMGLCYRCRHPPKSSKETDKCDRCDAKMLPEELPLQEIAMNESDNQPMMCKYNALVTFKIGFFNALKLRLAGISPDIALARLISEGKFDVDVPDKWEKVE